MLGFFISFSMLILAMSVHEFSHGAVAYMLGDTTAKSSGRLTLNPLAHIDPIGTVLLPLTLFILTRGQFVFGAAKPVPINYLALANPKRDIIWIGLSGPLSNLVFAFILSLLLRIIPAGATASYLVSNFIIINIILGVFNLVPIPPLDGSRILMGLLPDKLASKYASLEPVGFFIVLALIALGLFDMVIWPIVRVFYLWLGGASL